MVNISNINYYYCHISYIKQSDKIKIFHAGTVIKNNKIQVVGGRILTVNVFADTKEEAVNLGYLTADEFYTWVKPEDMCGGL